MARKYTSKKYGRRRLFRLNGTGAPLISREDCPAWERASQCYALLILAVFPLLMGPDTYINITLTKFLLFAVLTGLYVLVCVFLGFVYFPGKRRGRLLRERRGQKLTLPQLFLCAYLLWALLSAALSPYESLFLGQSRYEGLLSLLLYGTVFLLLSFWGEYTDGYAFGLGLMAALLGFFALLQTFGVRLFYPGEYNYWNVGFLSTVGHEDIFSGFVCLLFPSLLCAFVLLEGRGRTLCLPGLFLLPYLALYTEVDTAKLGLLTGLLLLPWLIQSRKRLQRLLLALAPVLAGLALALTWHKDRSFAPGFPALLALCLAAACAGLALWMGRCGREWTLRPAVIRRAAALTLLLLLLLGLLFAFRYSGENRLLLEFSEFLHGHLSDEAGSYRGYIWKNSLKLLAERPVLGGGPGSFSYRFVPYDPGYQELTGTPNGVDFPHNDFLYVACCTGLVELGLYLGFLLTLLLRCLRRAERCPVLLIFLAGLLGYLVYSAFVFSIAIISPLFWVLAGLTDHAVRQTDAAQA